MEYRIIQITFRFVVNLTIFKIYSRPVSWQMIWFSVALNPIDVPLNHIDAGGIELEMSLYDKWHSPTSPFCTNSTQMKREGISEYARRLVYK